MKAIVCKELGAAENLALEDISSPELSAGEILIDMHAGALNYPDYLQIQGKYQVQPPLPFTCGGEGAGVVAAVADGMTRVKPGDKVIAVGAGAFAEQMKTTEDYVLPMPEGMDFNTAAGFTTTYGTSYYALKQRAQLQPGETLLVLGAGGGVGTSAVEIGKAMGAHVIAAASSDEKLELAKQLGADQLYNYGKDGAAGLKNAVKEMTGGKGADVVYDPLGDDYSEQALRATAWNGRFLVIGFAAGDIPKIPINLTLLKGCSIVGVFWGAFTMTEPEESAKNFGEMLQMIEAGKLNPIITTVYSMEQYADAFNCLGQRRARGKVIIAIR
ncbi:MAG: NADPH:quinone oxidoreductase family protein [Pseudomonadales bacterium]